jgi:hypothetical protein
LNGKGFITWAAISAAIGVLTAWISITQMVIDPLKNRLEIARENLVREITRLETVVEHIDERVRELEHGKR